MSYQQVKPGLTLRQLNRDNAAQHSTHSSRDADQHKYERDPNRREAVCKVCGKSVNDPVHIDSRNKGEFVNGHWIEPGV